MALESAIMEKNMSHFMENNYSSKVLTILSLIVLVYSVAGGSFNGALELFGAKLTFKKPIYLEYVAVFVMMFLLWRHSAATRTVLHEVRREVIGETNIGQLSDFFARQLVLDLSNQGGSNTSERRFNVTPEPNIASIILSDARVLSFNVVVTYYLNGIVYEKEYVIRPIKNSPQFLLIQIKHAAVFFRVIFLKTQFWDVYYPMILSVVAFIMYVYNIVNR